MKPEEVAVREEIASLKIAYAHCYDGHDLDGLMSLFTDDAVCEYPSRFGGDWVGAGKIRQNFHAVMTTMEPFDTLHVVTNPRIDVTSISEASARWYLTAYTIRQSADVTLGGHANPLRWLGFYDDQYRKVGADWKIARTRLTFLWPDKSELE